MQLLPNALRGPSTAGILLIFAALAHCPATARAEEPAGLSERTVGQTAQQRQNEKRIREALAEMTDVSFFDDTLADAVLFLEDYHGVQIKIDKRALDDAGLGSDISLTTELRGVTLESALRIILSPYDLTYRIENEVLLITTPAATPSQLQTRIYSSPQFANLTAAEAQELTLAITTTVEPGNWVEDGPGVVQYFTPTGALIVRHSSSAHFEVESLLEALFAAQGENAAATEEAMP